MGRALSQDLRDRVVAAVEKGLSCRASAARFGVGVATAIRWRKMALTHGRAVARKPGGDQRSSKTEAHADVILAMLEEKGDITLAEIRAGLPTPASRSGSALSGASLIDIRSRAKKVGSRDRARPTRCPETAPHVVRRTTRS